GWASSKGDDHFKIQRERADTKEETHETIFHAIHTAIGKELAAAGAFDKPECAVTNIQALNLCMAPGAYTEVFLDIHPDATVKGITLPLELGGHPMTIPYGLRDPRVNLYFLDITMLAAEFGVTSQDIPPDHPDAKNFSMHRPHGCDAFDIVLCDGQTLRTHQRLDYRESREPLRLLTAQLILGMARIKPGGTFIILLHKADAFDTMQLLRSFSGFAKIALFKPHKGHTTRSTFYLIAKDVKSLSVPAIEAMENWKFDWQQATFGGEKGPGVDQEPASDEEVNAVLDDFGPELIKLCQPIWSIQAEALDRAQWRHEQVDQPRTPEHSRRPSFPLARRNPNSNFEPRSPPEPHTPFFSPRKGNSENKYGGMSQPQISPEKAAKMAGKWR
ncbi:MAG: hypothetical protein Q9167_008138, partial [Letrouitia subvulpina]